MRDATLTAIENAIRWVIPSNDAAWALLVMAVLFVLLIWGFSKEHE